MWRRRAYSFEHLGRSRVHGGCPHYTIIQIEPVSMATVKPEPFRLPAVGREGVIPIPPQLWIQHLAHMVCHAPCVFPLVTGPDRPSLTGDVSLGGGFAWAQPSCLSPLLYSWQAYIVVEKPSRLPALFSFLVKVFPPEHLFMFAPVLVSASQST